MAEPGLILVTGAGGGVGGVGGKVVALLRQRGRPVRAMAHHDDDRADALRALGADIVVGDLTRPADVANALDSVQRMFFSMSLAPSYLGPPPQLRRWPVPSATWMHLSPSLR
jgi:uncharacterized protein YbjT (DUF2867 family)